MITRTVAGQQFTFAADDVRRAVRGVLPEPLREHYVVIDGVRYPPKQVLSLLTGLDRADFTTHQARRVLQRAGIAAGRVGQEIHHVQRPTHRDDWPHGGREAEMLRAHQGRWVAQRGLDVLVAADTPQDVVAWLHEHGQRDAVIFRVPHREADVDGATVR